MAGKKQEIERISEMTHAMAFRTKAIDLWQKLDEMGMTFMQAQVLRFVSKNEGCLMKDLAEEFSVTLAAITGIADRLEEKGVLKRTEDPQDRRASRLRLTPRARSLMRRMDEARQKTMEEILKNLSKKERVQLMKGFEIFLKAASEFLSKKHT